MTTRAKNYAYKDPAKLVADIQASYPGSASIGNGDPVKLMDPAWLRRQIAALDAEGYTYTAGTGGNVRGDLMNLLDLLSPDQFDVMQKEAALQSIRLQRKGTRKSSFVTGQRGLEGPLANLILGGGTSMLGS